MKCIGLINTKSFRSVITDNTLEIVNIMKNLFPGGDTSKSVSLPVTLFQLLSHDMEE